LDRQTDLLLDVFPRPARHWGLARKGLNIFLRDCLYTVYLREAFQLGNAEFLFELPLDSLTGRAVWETSGKTVPRWTTIRALTPEVSRLYQQASFGAARELHTARVHLDALWWGERSGTHRLQ
jgi:hypothetical protein